MSSLVRVGLIGVTLRFVEEPPPGYTLLGPFLLLWSLAMARPCNILNRLSQVSVSIVEFQVRWPVQSMSILAWVGLIGVSLRFFGAPLDYVADTFVVNLDLCNFSVVPRSGSIVAALCFHS
jgi:hypothetical protein